MVDGTEYTTEIPEASCREYAGIPDRCRITSFIPGTIVELKVSQGDRVVTGDVLLLLDAMKMHNEICTEISGNVGKIHVSTGDTVLKDQLLVEIDID